MNPVEIIDQYGFAGVGIIAVTLGSIYVYNKIQDGGVTNATKHPFFPEVKRHLTNKIPNISLSHLGRFCRGRTHVFKVMLRIQLTNWKEALREFVSVNHATEDIYTEFVKAMDNAFMKTEKQFREEQIPEIVIQKFNSWKSVNRDMYIEGARLSATSRSFSSNNEVKNAILNLSMMILTRTVLDAEGSLGELNGDLTKEGDYKGYPFE